MYIKDTHIRRTCIMCGKRFKPTQGNQQTCSEICRKERHREQRIENQIRRKIEKTKRENRKNLKYTLEDVCYIERIFNKYIKEYKIPLSYQNYSDIVLKLDQGIITYNYTTKHITYKGTQIN